MPRVKIIWIKITIGRYNSQIVNGILKARIMPKRTIKAMKKFTDRSTNRICLKSISTAGFESEIGMESRALIA